MMKIKFLSSIVIDIVSMIIIFIFAINQTKNIEMIFMYIYIAFFISHIYDKYKRLEMTKKLNLKKIGNRSKYIYASTLIMMFFINVKLFDLILNKIYISSLISALLLVYFISIIHYDNEEIYYDKNNIVYGNRKIDLLGIKKIKEDNKWFIKKITVFYTKKESTTINFFYKSNLEKFKEFLEKSKCMKNGKK